MPSNNLLNRMRVGLASDSARDELAALLPKYESLITTEALEVADHNTTFLLSLAGGFTITLPTVAQVLASDAGAWYAKFIVGIQPTTAYIITEDAADTNVVIGGINELEVDTSDDGPYSAGFTNINFVASTAVVGDYVEIFGNGVNWYINGQTNVDGGITLT